MTKNSTFFILLLFCLFISVNGQTVIQNFEADSPASVTRYGATFSVVANPDLSGNTTANCAKIGRTGTDWYELIAFNITPYEVPANTTKYLHVLVNYPAQPDISVRFDAANSGVDGSGDLRALNKYTNFNQWQDLVFKIDGGTSGTTVDAIVFLADVGFENTPAEQILNNTTAFGYVDEFTFSDSATPTLSNSNLELNDSIGMYPNPTSTVFKIETNDNTNIEKVVLYDVLGNQVVKNVVEISKNEFDISGLSSGLYLVRIISSEGGEISKKLIKK